LHTHATKHMIIVLNVPHFEVRPGLPCNEVL
jgi:hypothetical protein